MWAGGWRWPPWGRATSPAYLSGPGRSPAAPGNGPPTQGGDSVVQRPCGEQGEVGWWSPGKEGAPASHRGCPEGRSPAGRLPGTQAFASGSACLPPGLSSLRIPGDTSTPLVRSSSATGWWPLAWGFTWLRWSKWNGAWGPSAAHRARHGRCPGPCLLTQFVGKTAPLPIRLSFPSVPGEWGRGRSQEPHARRRQEYWV